MKLYYAETMNPRKVCATARHLDVPLDYVKVDLARGEHKSAEHLARNPGGRVPVLVDGDVTVWESVAIMIHLADKADSELWPRDTRAQVEVIRWTSFDAWHFAPRAGMFYREHYIRPRLLGLEPRPALVADVEGAFHESARLLDAHLEGRTHLVDDRLTIADFCLAAMLPDAAASRLPIGDYTNLVRWHERLMELPAWRDPWPA